MPEIIDPPDLVVRFVSIVGILVAHVERAVEAAPVDPTAGPPTAKSKKSRKKANKEQLKQDQDVSKLKSAIKRQQQLEDLGITSLTMFECMQCQIE
jgi:hypothetical protein